MRRLHPEKTFLLTVSPPGLVLAMEQQDVEETVGNLLDNAARYATEQVRVTVQSAPEGLQGKDPGRRNWISIDVDDDGPGLEPEQIAVAVKRGRRLDESKPGTGLGLSIVSEIAGEYQGTLDLSRGERGGLNARILLPAVS
jgi:signal transduction histidine kinase